MELEALKEKLAGLVAEMKAILDGETGGNLDEGKRNRFDSLDKESRSLKAQI